MRHSNLFPLLLLSFLSITLLSHCSLPPANEEEGKEENKEPGDNDSSWKLPWEGETDKFTLTAKEGIRLNDPQEAAGTAYITTESSTVRNTRWEIGVRLTFNPSAANYARYYLTSSSTDLSAELNGYFLQIGGEKDNIALYRQTGKKLQLLASSRELMKNNNAPKLFIKAECDANGWWTLWTRLETESAYTLERQVKDTTFQKSSCSGILCVYTVSRRKGFTFHHLQTSNGVETVVPPHEPDDPSENPDEPVTPPDAEEPEHARNMLLFNEVMYHHVKNGAEYIELYNPADTTVSISSLLLYKMRNTGEVFSTTVLQPEDEARPLIIPPKSYICFTKSVYALINQHKVGKETLIEVSNFPALSNEGGYLAIVTPGKKLIDKCCFLPSMHTVQKTQGISLEKRSPELSSLNANWHSSSDPTGGTPGIKNSEK